jgi:hypothetical protein
MELARENNMHTKEPWTADTPVNETDGALPSSNSSEVVGRPEGSRSGALRVKELLHALRREAHDFGRVPSTQF